MKRLLAFVATVVVSMTTFAQGHISFKGVPLDGTLKEYTKKMQEKGFEYLGTSPDGIALLSGDFAGYKGCIVGVSTLDKVDVVSRIVVIFPECVNWGQLEGNYDNLKEMLSEKYGKPSQHKESFQSSYVKDDSSKMHEVKMNRCDYISVFESEHGSIQLEIIATEGLQCHVRLAYYDKVNSNVVRAAAIDDL